jgi:hypothetical protein
MIKRLMSKKANLFGKQIPVFVIALIALIGFASATVYVVNTINLTVGVKEAFTVEYAILGDSSNYNGELCANASYLPLENNGIFDKDGFYPMESRFICIKIINAGQASIPYVINSTTTGSQQNEADCKAAFPSIQKIGLAASGENIDGAFVQIAADAKNVSDCNIQITVGRGTVST